MNWHEVIDERNYEMDQVIVGILRENPAKLKVVVERIKKFLADESYSSQSKAALSEWLEIIVERGVDGVIEILSARSEEAARLRQNSPFSILMPQEKRLEILSRYEARRPRTHPASV
jgi:hypothetical protein